MRIDLHGTSRAKKVLVGTAKLANAAILGYLTYKVGTSPMDFTLGDTAGGIDELVKQGLRVAVPVIGSMSTLAFLYYSVRDYKDAIVGHYKSSRQFLEW